MLGMRERMNYAKLQGVPEPLLKFMEQRDNSAGAVVARADLQAFLLRRLETALKNRGQRIDNRRWFRKEIYSRGYYRELKRVLGPGFLVYRERDSQLGRQYVAIYIGVWPERWRQKSGLIELM